MKIENLETMENISEGVSVTSSPFPLERDSSYQSDIHTSIKQNVSFEGRKHNPEFGSGFDAEHPYPTFEQLCEAGFRSEVAFSISEEYRNPYSNAHHPYTKRELYHVLYESDDPVKAYNEMMEEKFRKKLDKFDKALDDVINKYL